LRVTAEFEGAVGAGQDHGRARSSEPC
jgi:hypothetical protein